MSNTRIMNYGGLLIFKIYVRKEKKKSQVGLCKPIMLNTSLIHFLKVQSCYNEIFALITILHKAPRG